MIHTAMKVPKPSQKREDKAYRKQRKQIRKMIRRQMMDHSREVIQSLIQEDQKGNESEPQITEETKASEGQDNQSETEAVHKGFICDGCNMDPIVGPRFKCTVRKNFDYCANCERTKESPHAFLKIDTPAQAPRAMFTIIDENTPGEADIDINLDNMGQAFQQFGHHFGGMGGRGGRCGPWGRRGHGPHGGMGGMRGPHGPPHGPRFQNEDGTPNEGRGPCGGMRGMRGPHGPRFQNQDGTPNEGMGPCGKDWGKKWGGCGKKWGQDGQNWGNGNGPCGMNKHMKNKIGYFMRQMFGDQAMHNADETDQPTYGNKNDHFVHRKNPRRAIPMSHPGQKVHVGCVGDVIMVELVFRNGGNHKYHETFHMEGIIAKEHQNTIAPIKMPLPETAPMGTFTVQVPFTILDTADIFNQEIIVLVGVTNHHGEEVGMGVPIKLKIVEKIDETALYDKAMQLMAQTGLTFDEEGNFDKAIQTLKEAEYHVDKACAMLINEQQPEDKEE